MFVYPRPGEAVLTTWYSDAGFYDEAEQQEPRLRRLARSRLQKLSRLARRYGLEKTLLDVGCASGLFMEEAVRAGWTAFGIDISEPLLSRARQKGLQVARTMISDLVTEPRRFAFITAWELIEHLGSPSEFMRALHALNGPRGVVALSTPMVDGIPARLLRERFPMFCPPGHLSLFSRSSMRQLADDCGYRIIAISSFSNLGFENLRRGCDRFIVPRALPRPLRLVLNSTLAAVLRPAAPLMDACLLGCEMEVYFRYGR